MTHVIKKCPYCGKTYSYSSGDQRCYGYPYKTCLYCNKSFWDTDVKEPALHGYINAHEVKESILRGIFLVLFSSVSLGLIIASIFTLADGMVGEFFIEIAVGAFSAIMPVIHIKRKLYERKHKDTILADKQKRYDESLSRLKDTNYLYALSQHDRLAKRLLEERINGDVEHYANRP